MLYCWKAQHSSTQLLERSCLLHLVDNVYQLWFDFLFITTVEVSNDGLQGSPL
jgi:hypothetical protein